MHVEGVVWVLSKAAAQVLWCTPLTHSRCALRAPDVLTYPHPYNPRRYRTWWCTVCYTTPKHTTPAEVHTYTRAPPHPPTHAPRRYADVVVHRLLAASIDLEPLPDSARDRWEQMQQCGNNMHNR